MDVHIIILFTIIGISTLMFITEIFSVDKIAFLVMVSLFLTGLVSGEEAISGFSNPAVITIISLMIITAALESNGTIGLLSDFLLPIIKWPLQISLPTLMLVVGIISAFSSTTAVVILFVRIMPEISKKFNISLEKYMMPISFAGILGGSCTLMGTSTNLIVNQIAIANGLEGFDFFEVTLLASCLLVIGIFSISLFSIFLLKKKNLDYANRKPVARYISYFKVLGNNPIIGKSYKSSALYNDSQLNLLQIKRGKRVIRHPSYWQKFKKDDILVVSTHRDKILSLNNQKHFESISENQDNTDDDFNGDIIELLILPDSNLIGRDFGDLDSSDLEGGMPLAINKHRSIFNASGKFVEDRISRVRIDPGDRLIIQLDGNNDDNWNYNDTSLIMDHMDHPNVRSSKKYITLGILLLVIALAATSVLPILESALLGVALHLVTQTVTLQHAYESINWQIIFLLVGLLPLGIAMSNTGADKYLGEILLRVFQDLNSNLIIGALFLVTMLVSGVLSNNATAIIITPIAISLANGLNINPIPFLVVIMLAANFSFFTPIGYQTNTIVYGMGIYRFRDFMIVGGLLSLILWISSALLIPIIYSM